MTTTTLERPRKGLPTAKRAAVNTMYAARVHDFQRPLELQEVPIPVAGPGEVVVRIEASGLCHTDIHAAHGDWPIKPTPPFAASRRSFSATASRFPGSAMPAERATTA